jgi:hypothetical protein
VWLYLCYTAVFIVGALLFTVASVSAPQRLRPLPPEPQAIMHGSPPHHPNQLTLTPKVEGDALLIAVTNNWETGRFSAEGMGITDVRTGKQIGPPPWRVPWKRLAGFDGSIKLVGRRHALTEELTVAWLRDGMAEFPTDSPTFRGPGSFKVQCQIGDLKQLTVRVSEPYSGAAFRWVFEFGRDDRGQAFFRKAPTAPGHHQPQAAKP